MASLEEDLDYAIESGNESLEVSEHSLAGDEDEEDDEEDGVDDARDRGADHRGDSNAGGDGGDPVPIDDAGANVGGGSGATKPKSVQVTAAGLVELSSLEIGSFMVVSTWLAKELVLSVTGGGARAGSKAARVAVTEQQAVRGKCHKLTAVPLSLNLLRRGLSVFGKKAARVARLEAHLAEHGDVAPPLVPAVVGAVDTKMPTKLLDLHLLCRGLSTLGTIAARRARLKVALAEVAECVDDGGVPVEAEAAHASESESSLRLDSADSALFWIACSLCDKWRIVDEESHELYNLPDDDARAVGRPPFTCEEVETTCDEPEDPDPDAEPGAAAAVAEGPVDAALADGADVQADTVAVNVHYIWNRAGLAHRITLSSADIELVAHCCGNRGRDGLKLVLREGVGERITFAVSMRQRSLAQLNAYRWVTKGGDDADCGHALTGGKTATALRHVLWFEPGVLAERAVLQMFRGARVHVVELPSVTRSPGQLHVANVSACVRLAVHVLNGEMVARKAREWDPSVHACHQFRDLVQAARRYQVEALPEVPICNYLARDMEIVDAMLFGDLAPVDMDTSPSEGLHKWRKRIIRDRVVSRSGTSGKGARRGGEPNVVALRRLQRTSNRKLRELAKKRGETGIKRKRSQHGH